MNPESEHGWLERALDRPEDDRAWLALEAEAASDPALWRRAAEAFRASACVDLTAEALRSLAARVPAPAKAAEPLPARARHLGRRLARCAAAALLLAVAISADRALFRSGAGGAAAPAAGTFDEAIERCLAEGGRSGRVLRPLPELVVEQRPAADGPGVEVIYIRRILERRVLPAIYELTMDDAGKPVAMPVALAQLRRAASF